MSSNAIFFGWNRSIPGRERLSAQHFDEFVQYLVGLQQNGTIKSFDVVLLNAHGGDMNGFFLIRGESGKLGELVASTEWVRHQTRAALHLETAGAVLGVTGEAITERMKLWTSLLPT
ncbi:MAG: hypothetical protein JJE04_24205 [Acidobacteriia bacterium]|nr:hypothetical protein [Terriglobia bacterium]